MFRWLSVFLTLQLSRSAIREPWVETLSNVFAKDDCRRIIKEAESVGFPNTVDSTIDNDEPRATASWALGVVEQKVLKIPTIAAMYEKYFPTLRDLVADRKFKMNNGDKSVPVADWVVLRKYAAGRERQMLKLHHDVNMYTIVIALNDNFEGGGFVYQQYDDKYYEDDKVIPSPPHFKLSYDYLKTIRRRNTTDMIFPNLSQGDLLIHNYSLYHAVAPIEKGIRYSLVFFFDMSHPDIRAMNYLPNEIKIYNQFEVVVDLFMIEFTSTGFTRHLIEEDLEVEYLFEANPRTRYQVVNQETGDVVDEFVAEDPVRPGEATVIYVGPDNDEKAVDSDDALDIPAVIENAFPYPVSLYWVTPEVQLKLIEEEMNDVLNLDTVFGHKFFVLKRGTKEVVHKFEVVENTPEGSFLIRIGPQKQAKRPSEREL